MKRNFNFIFLTALLSLASVSAKSQSITIDSLKKLLDNSDRITQSSVDILCQLAYEFYDYNDSIALDYSERALSDALNIKYQAGTKYALTLAGIGHMTKGDYEKSIDHLQRSRNILVKDADTLDVYSLILEGNIYRNISKYDSALNFYDKALGIASSKGAWRWVANVRKNISMLRLVQWKNREALMEAKLAIEALKKVGNLSVAMEVYSAMGRAYLNLNKYDSAAICFERMCSLTSQSNLFNRIRCLLLWSEYYQLVGNTSLALDKCFEALKLSEDYNYPPQVIEIYLALGNIQSELSNYDLAARYLFEGVKMAREYKLRYLEANLLGQLGLIKRYVKEYSNALSYTNEALKIREEINDMFGVAKSYNARGLIYIQQKKYDEALAEFKMALAIRKSLGFDEGISSTVHNMGLVHEEKGNFNQAIEQHLIGLEIDSAIGNNKSIARTYSVLGRIKFKQGKMREALDLMLQAHSIAEESGARLILLENAKSLSEYYAFMNDYKKAFQYQKQYQVLNDSIYTISSSTKLAEMEVLYQIEQRDQQIKILNQGKKLSDQELQLQRGQIKLQYIIIAFGSLGLLLLILLAWNFYVSNRKIRQASHEILEQKEEIQAQSEELVEANQTIAQINRDLEDKVEQRTSELKQAYKELDTFFYRSSHDFRRPLTTFLGLAEVAKITVKDSNALELFDKVKETATTLDKMLIKLQSISDVGLNELVYKEVFLKDIFDSVCDQYRDLIQSKKVDVVFECDQHRSFYSYPAIVKVIFENLIENSLQFASLKNPVVSVIAKQEGTMITLEFSDNGQGIEEEYQARVFDMYFRANHQSKGNGLGLYIVQKAVNKLRGEISLVSKKNEGTTFTVVLPIG